MTVDVRTCSLPAHVARGIEALAKRYDRPVEDLLAEAVGRYLEEEQDFVEKVETRLANVEAGKTVSWDEAKREFRDMIARAEAFNKAV